MKIASRMFLNTVDMTDTSFAMIDGCFRDGKYRYILKISFGYFVVNIHSVADTPEAVQALFVPKLMKLLHAINGALASDMNIPQCERTWLNGEMEDVKHYTGAISWSVDKNTWQLAISDCNRTIRVDPKLSDIPTTEEIYYLEMQQNKIRTLGCFIDSIITQINGD